MPRNKYENKKEYKTFNLNLSAALLSKGIPLISFEKVNGKVSFVFANSYDCHEYEKLWLMNQLEVPAFEYSQALRRLKSIVFGGSDVVRES